mmetsp:Transcript_27798/g.41223  ORF Transcript_27798/g.41223 Transcript_27798/m.41223 type:complete len:256 (-) Transcript_27798:58-825(-)
MKLAIITTVVASASAFAPSTVQLKVNSMTLRSTPETVAETAAEPTPVVASINGWTPDAALPCYGLPGDLAPTGFFDPLGFAQKGIGLNDVKRNREAEVMHGRVAMIASLGYLGGEALNGPFNIAGPANDQLQQMPAPAFAILTALIAATELNRARIGWLEPDFGSWNKTLWKLRENYYPGDIGFDPLNLKPEDPKAFASMQTRELQNGRLAMLGVAGMCAQELVNHRTIFETIDFYQKVYGGENPYAICGDSIIC